MIISLITLKYTQSNSVCYVKDGQAIGIGAGQQSRIHCTRLAGNKADIWWLRQSEQVLGLNFVDDIRRADRDNAIDIYLSDDYMDVLADGVWQGIFKEKPEVFTKEMKEEWLKKNTGVCLGSDAFSHLVILSVLIKVVYHILHSLVALSGMIMLLKHVISII